MLRGIRAVGSNIATGQQASDELVQDGLRSMREKGKAWKGMIKSNQSRCTMLWLRICVDFGRLYSDPDLGGQKLPTNTENGAEI